MKNRGYRLLRSATWIWSFAVALAMVSQPPNLLAQQKVAPPSQGYGNRATQPPAPVQPGANSQGANGNGAPPNGNPQPNLNPNLNNPVPQGALQPGKGSGNEIITSDPFAKTPLSPQELQMLDQVLGYWEKSTSDITRYSSKFRRWQYNSNDNFVGQLATQLRLDIRQVNTTVAAGVVKYSAPDQGMFKIETLLSLTGQVNPKDNKPEYKEYPNRFGEWWLCDGEYVYDFDRNSNNGSKPRCTKHELPADMKGKAILDSPMPFVFGIKADKLKQRYWLRMLPTQDNNVFGIQAHPKFQSDLANYHHVDIYLDRELFLPMTLVKYNSEHVDEPDATLNDSREIFEFTDREKNATLFAKFSEKLWRQEFIPFAVTKDWELIEVPFVPQGGDIRSATVPPNNPSRR
jgi:TIGR03009 family protein